jgi:molybdopterin converting factor small subunit
MTLRVQFFSHLKDVAGVSELPVEIAAGTTVEDLLALLYGRIPKLKDWDNSILIGAGVEFVGRQYALEPNDEIAIMPPVQGG